MLFNGGDTCGLFSGAIMVTINSSSFSDHSLTDIQQQSGSPRRLPDILDHQIDFDNLVSATNCTAASDRLDCLRQTPFSTLQAAVNASPGLLDYQSMKQAWGPMVDGTLIPDNPMRLVKDGKYARVRSFPSLSDMS